MVFFKAVAVEEDGVDIRFWPESNMDYTPGSFFLGFDGYIYDLVHSPDDSYRWYADQAFLMASDLLESGDIKALKEGRTCIWY